MEVIRSSETSVYIRPTQRYIPEDGYFQTKELSIPSSFLLSWKRCLNWPLAFEDSGVVFISLANCELDATVPFGHRVNSTVTKRHKQNALETSLYQNLRARDDDFLVITS
jgi:hypothetical protein